MRIVAPILAYLICQSFPAAAHAQAGAEISLYGATQVGPSGEVGFGDLNSPGLGYSLEWDRERSAGLRVTWWQTDTLGFGVDFSNSESLASDSAHTGPEMDDMRQDDGLALVTLNAYRRWENSSGHLSPYVGAGLGLALPHFQEGRAPESAGAPPLTGAAMQFVAGARIPITGNLSLFGEYQGSYTSNFDASDTSAAFSAPNFGSGINIGVALGF